jgi:hypothetical protein
LSSLGVAKDKIIFIFGQLSPHFVTISSSLETQVSGDSFASSFVRLIGTSNIKGIDEERLSAKFVTHKCTAYTFEQTFEKLDSVRFIHYDAVVLHCLTNELAKESPDTCVSKLDEIALFVG